MAWASSRLTDDVLASVLVWKDYLPFRLLPAAAEIAHTLHMHPLSPAMHGGLSEAAANRSSNDAGFGWRPSSTPVVQAIVEEVQQGFRVSTAPPACVPNSSW